jgi:sulfur-carrier protein
MAYVHLTSHLRRFFPGLSDGQVHGATVADIVGTLEERHKGLARYLTDERGALRPHVHVFVRDELIHDRVSLSDPVGPDDRVHILQALSGG